MNYILNHNMVRIWAEGGFYQMQIAMQNGGWVYHNPFPLDQRGLVAALSLAVDVLAGKIWLSHVKADMNSFNVPEPLRIENGKNDVIRN